MTSERTRRGAGRTCRFDRRVVFDALAGGSFDTGDPCSVLRIGVDRHRVWLLSGLESLAARPDRGPEVRIRTPEPALRVSQESRKPLVTARGRFSRVLRFPLDSTPFMANTAGELSVLPVLRVGSTGHFDRRLGHFRSGLSFSIEIAPIALRRFRLARPFAEGVARVGCWRTVRRIDCHFRSKSRSNSGVGCCAVPQRLSGLSRVRLPQYNTANSVAG